MRTEPLRYVGPDGQAEPGFPVLARMQRATCGVEGALEQEILDSDVVVEPLQMAQVGDRYGRVRVNVRGAVAGQLETVGLGDGCGAQPDRDAAASGRVRLQAVHRRDHAGEVGEVVSVFSGRDVGGDGVAHLGQAGEVVG